MKEEMARLEAMNPTVKERMLHAITTSIWAPLMLPEEEQIMVPMKAQISIQQNKNSDPTL